MNNKNRRKFLGGIVGILIVIFLWFLWSDLSFAHAVNTNNELVRSGNTLAALKGYESLTQKYPQRRDLTQYNSGVVLYEQGAYEKAKESFDHALEACISTGTYCSSISYNTGNTQYRLGEAEEELEARHALWSEAITSYEADLVLDPEDVVAQENIDFIRQKMTQEEQQEQEESQEGEEGEQGEDGEKKDGEEGESSEGEGQEGEEGQDGQEGQDGEGGQEGEGGEGSESESEGETSEQNTAQAQKLDPNTNAQVDAYMQEMQQREQEMQEYFSQNPDAQNSNNPNDSLFNDPFFQSFFGNKPSNPQFNDKDNIVEKDW